MSALSGSRTGTIARPDLPDRLRAAGLVPEETETVEIGRVEAMAAGPSDGR